MLVARFMVSRVTFVRYKRQLVPAAMVPLVFVLITVNSRLVPFSHFW